VICYGNIEKEKIGWYVLEMLKETCGDVIEM